MASRRALQGGPSAQSLASDTGLRDNAPVPAGSRFSEGQTITSGGNQSNPAVPAQQQPKTPFYKKRAFIISQLIIIPLGIVLLFVLLFPVVRAIVQSVVNKSTLDVQVADITSPTNGSFLLAMEGNVAHTGVISAKISFPDPVNVSWITHDGPEIDLGYLTLDTLHASHKRATINQTATPFVITNQTAFVLFSQHLITDQNFTWRLHSNNLRVQALKFPVSKGIKFNKQITLNGFRSFNGGVAIQDFQLPSDNPAGGIDFVAVTRLTNPSPFRLELGTVVFSLSYKNVDLGLGRSTDTIIAPGNNTITLKGVLEGHTDPSELAVVSELFTNYLNSISSPVIATGVSTLQNDNSSISWLSSGLQALKLNVPLVPPTPINPIRAISIGDFALEFSQNTPWAPSAQSNTVQASLELPFGFNLSIGQIANDFNITMMDGSTVAGLSTPIGASSSQITVYGQTNTSGTVDIKISDTNLSCPTAEHPNFATFNTGLTNQAVAPFRLVGHSRTIAQMGIGNITLDPINVDVQTSLKGLQGLKGMATIETVDVKGGTSDGITLGIQVVIFNPSNLKLSLGDLTLQLVRDGAILGTATMSNLVLNMGNNTVQTSSNFQANKSPQGLQTLNEFVGKKDVQLSIAGFDGTTKIDSLAPALKTLDIDVTLPALKSDLLNTAALEVLPTTGRSSNVSHVTVAIANPFTAPLEITSISSTVSAFGVLLGTINSTSKFTNPGKTTTTSPNLDLDMNFDPSTLFSLTRRLALEANLDVAPLDQIVELGDISYLPAASTSSSPVKRGIRRDNLFTNFNLPNFVQTAFKKLKSDVELTTGVTIGDYATTLTYTQSSLTTKTDQSLNLILPILAQPIVQKIVGGSLLNLDTVLISDAKQTSFTSKLNGAITNAGPFDASIKFGDRGLTVNWAGKPLGHITMEPLKVAADTGATLDTTSTFAVADVDHLTAFTKTLLTEENFEWQITGDNLTVSALGIDVSGISVAYKVTLKGFNGLKGGVVIKSFDLPSNDPAGGIHLTIDSTVTNPSQVGIQLSSLGFQAFAENGVMIAPVSATSVSLAPGSTSSLALVGRLVPQSSPEGLATVSAVFNNFVHGKDSNVLVNGASAGSSDVTWLNEGIKALSIATVLPNQGPLRVIKSIDLNELKLLFTQNTAYNPATSSSDTAAAFTLPFAFPLDITALEQTITVGFKGESIAQLALPKASAKTDVSARIIHLTFDSVPFAVLSGKQSNFDDFVAATTVGKTETLHLSGSANADAKTAVGLLSLTDIAFSVDSDIAGLQGLNTRPVTVANLDVNHGFPDHLLIKVDSALFNPSNLTIGTGDVSFNLGFQDQTIGTADISNLVIKPGNASYPIDVNYAPQGSAAAAGQKLLENFLQGVDSDTAIAGTTGSTPINSLKTALSQILLKPVTIPALHQTLIKSATIQFPTNIVQTGISQAAFTLANPFTASINLLHVGAVAKFHSLTLGTIDADVSSNPIHADGHSSVTSSFLPMKYNLNPLVIIQFLSTLAQENSVNLGPLVAMFQYIVANPNIKVPVTTTVATSPPTCVSGNQFDVGGAILAALKNLKVDLQIDTNVKLDDFATPLSFVQNAIPVNTDRTALFLIGAVAGPIAQHLVDGSVLAFNEANITNISEDGFDLSLSGSLTNIGPLDALIDFPEPLSVTWQGQHIAQIALPSVCAAANTGVPNYVTKARLTITDAGKFTDFATFLLHNPEFTWTISTSKLRLTALGTIFDNVVLSKDLTFKAFNNLPGITISNFQLPSDDPAGGIHIETDAGIPSPAQLGIDLGTVTFTSFFMGSEVGPLTGSNLFLAPKATTKSHLSGRIIPQSGSDLQNIGVLFSNFLAGEDQILTIEGNSVQPTGSSQAVNWLTTAFKTLNLKVTLPGQAFKIITEIDLDQLALIMVNQDQAFAPLASSSYTLAKYKNPFGFSLQVVESAQDLLISELGLDIARLHIPMSPTVGGVSTGNEADLVITFEDLPLVAATQNGFQLLFAATTLTPSIDFVLSGSANVSARTTIGDVPINGIPFNLDSTLKGMCINSFGNTAALSNVSVTGSGGNGGAEFIVSPLTTTLQNPSNVSLDTVDISLPVIYKGVKIGRAVIDELDLVPGQNVVATEFHYQPADANDTVAQRFLADFIQGNSDLPLTIQGDLQSSPFASLAPALSSLTLATSIHALNQPNLITHVNVFISLESLVTNIVSINFDFQNPLDTDLVIEFVQSNSGEFGETFAFFAEAIDNFVIPAHGTANSGTINNVLLTQGAIASLVIIPDEKLDIQAASTVRIGRNGYRVPWLHLDQTSVPTTYTLDLGLTAMKEKAVAISQSASASASSAASAAASGVGETSTTASISSTTPKTDDTKDTQSTVAASSQPSAPISAAEAESPATTASQKPPSSSSSSS